MEAFSYVMVCSLPHFWFSIFFQSTYSSFIGGRFNLEWSMRWQNLNSLEPIFYHMDLKVELSYLWWCILWFLLCLLSVIMFSSHISSIVLLREKSDRCQLSQLLCINIDLGKLDNVDHFACTWWYLSMHEVMHMCKMSVLHSNFNYFSLL